MKIGILSFRPLGLKASVEEIEIKKAAQRRGHTSRIFRSKRFQMIYDQESPWLLYNGKTFPKYDVMITRPSVLQNASLEISLIEQMELMGTLLFNRYDSILKTKNKVKTMQILDHHGIPIPKTVVVRRIDDLEQAVKLVGGFPLILKEPYGSFGKGVTIAESMRALKSILFWNKPMYLLQEFVKFSRGKDTRVFVIDGKVVGAMERSARKGEFRSNIELGGIGKAAETTEEEDRIAIRAVDVLELNYGGVDIVKSKNGPLVLEVNSNPGFKALEEAIGISVAGELVDYAIDLAERHKLKTTSI
ncbi:RimK family alpha-L-glutamate ligase [Patescibacteria group bacterium]